MYWLSYGGGVNSTALAILMIQGKLPQYDPWRIVFSDTGCERDETYAYIRDVWIPYLEANGKTLEIVKPMVSVMVRWENQHNTGNRFHKDCSREAKRRVIRSHIERNGGGEQLIGFDIGEAHRATHGQIYPLVDLGVDRLDCDMIIREAGLPSPGKSGCWCCPHSRVGDVIRLVKEHPCRADRIERLEQAANQFHGGNHYQFQYGPIAYWRDRACQQDLFIPEADPDMPCDCYDG